MWLAGGEFLVSVHNIGDHTHLVLMGEKVTTVVQVLKKNLISGHLAMRNDPG